MGKSYGGVVTMATMDTVIINGHAQLCDLLSNQTGTEYGRLSSVVARPQQTDKWHRRRQAASRAKCWDMFCVDRSKTLEG